MIGKKKEASKEHLDFRPWPVLGVPRHTCPRCGGEGMLYNNALLGSYIRKQRNHNEITQRSLAEEMGISPSYLSDLERSHRLWSKILLHEVLSALSKLEKKK